MPDCEKAATVSNVGAKYQERDVQLSLFQRKPTSYWKIEYHPAAEVGIMLVVAKPSEDKSDL